MPEKATLQRAKEDLREGKSPSTAAGEFVREEIDHVREGKQWSAFAAASHRHRIEQGAPCGDSVETACSGKDECIDSQKAEKDYEKGRTEPQTELEGSTARGRSRLKIMQKEPKSSASHKALSDHAKQAARKRNKES